MPVGHRSYLVGHVFRVGHDDIGRASESNVRGMRPRQVVGRFGLVSYENHDSASASGGSEKTKLDPRQNAAMQNDRFGLELSDESAGRRDNSKVLGKRSSRGVRQRRNPGPPKQALGHIW